MKNIEGIISQLSYEAKKEIEGEFTRQTENIYCDRASDAFFNTKGEISVIKDKPRDGTEVVNIMSNGSTLIDFLETVESKSIIIKTDSIRSDLQKFVSDSLLEIVTCIMNKWRDEMEKLSQEYIDYIKKEVEKIEGKNLDITISYSQRHGLDYMAPYAVDLSERGSTEWFEDEGSVYTQTRLKIKNIYGVDTSGETIYITSKCDINRKK